MNFCMNSTSCYSSAENFWICLPKMQVPSKVCDPIDILRPESGLAGLRPPLCMKRELTGLPASWLGILDPNYTCIGPLRGK